MKIEVEVSAGELLDKISILEIKQERIGDPSKLANINKELATLERERDRCVQLSGESAEVYDLLRSTNEALWDIEDHIRECERAQDFGPRFIALARSVYFQNDKRALYKRQLNELLGSNLIEEKSYSEYSSMA